MWICLLKEWHPGISHSLPLGFHTTLSTLERIPSTEATGWGHPTGSQWVSSRAPSCSTGVVWIWLCTSGVTLLLRWRRARADISGLFECLPEAKSSISTAEVSSVCSKSRAQLISHHRSPLGGNFRAALVTNWEDLPAKGHHQVHPPSQRG